jgi:hypothetical protein
LNSLCLLYKLFRGEFIFPTEGLEVNLDKTLRSLEADNVIKVTRQSTIDSSSTPAGTVEWVELSDAERESGRENYDFYCFLIWPFIEASWLGAVSLMMLTPPEGYTGGVNHEVKKVQDRAQLVRIFHCSYLLVKIPIVANFDISRLLVFDICSFFALRR